MSQCDADRANLQEYEKAQQRRLLSRANRFSDAPVALGNLLYCRHHRRPLIECYDAEG